MKVWRCECGWVIEGREFLKRDYNDLCPRCGRRYSTFKPAPEIHIDASRSVLSNRRPRAKRQSEK